MGSMTSATTDTEDVDVPAPRRWESRGTVLGVWIDVGGSLGKHLVVMLGLVVAVVPVVNDEGGANTCKKWESHGLSHGDMWFCGYISGYILSFVAVALSALLLLGGRNLIHKRFYYGLLKANGILEYEHRFPFRDPLVALIAWDFLHVVGYGIFVLYVMGKAANGPNDEVEISVSSLLHTEAALRFHRRTQFLQSHTLGVVTLEPTTPMPTYTTTEMPETTTIPAWLSNFSKDPDVSHSMLAHCILVWTMLLPSLLFILFLYSDYNISASLVPLSEFVEDDDEKVARRDLNALRTIKEAGLKHTLAKFVKEEELRFQSLANHKDSHTHDVEIVFSAVLPFWKRVRKEVKEDKLGPVNLVDSLWPAPVIMDENLGDEPSRVFRKTCKAYFAFAVLALFALIFVLGEQLYQNVAFLFSPSNWKSGPTLGAIVSIAHLAVVGWTIKQIWTCPHLPAEASTGEARGQDKSGSDQHRSGSDNLATAPL